MNLFLEPNLQFEKTAAEVKLPEDPARWPTELLQEIYKQAPYIADYEPKIIMQMVDPEQGYGLGHVEVATKTEGVGDPRIAPMNVKKARIPIVISESKLCPLDLIVTEDSGIMPLNEQRLRQAMFRPDTFDITAKTPGDLSMISMLYPPYRQNYGFAGGGGVVVPADGGAKVASSKKGLLEAAVASSSQAEYQKVARELACKDVALAVRMNKVASPSISTIIRTEPKSDASPEKLARAFEPTVIQICREGSAYAVKHASAAFWYPTKMAVDRGQVVRVFGEKIATDVDMAGSVTIGTDKDAPEVLPEEAELVKEFGIYKVQAEDGKHLMGYVFPNLLDLEGDPMPIALFTNGSESAVQGEIVGVRVGSGAALLEGPPRGYGTFYRINASGKADAMMPLDISTSITMEEQGSTIFPAITMDGRKINVQLQPNIKIPCMVDETTLLVPDSFKWMPLNKTNSVSLIGRPDQYGQVDQEKAAAGQVFIRGNQTGSFSLSGLPIDKVAQEDRSFLDVDDTMFYLVGLGVSPKTAMAKIAAAVAGYRPIPVSTTKVAQPVEHLTATKKVAHVNFDAFFSGTRLLVKEAAVIPDPTAVDTVLSLGFLNPENVSTFIGYLPNIEMAARNMAALLLASRLGLREIPVNALERALKATEEVLQGLKALAFQKNLRRMIRSPCEFYIKALLLDPTGYSPEVILERLYQEGLDPIGLSYIERVRLALPPTPVPFMPYDAQHKASKRYLRAEEIYEYFHRTEEMAIANKMLISPRVKEYLESMLLLGAPRDRIAHGARTMGAPYCTTEAVDTYAHFYWNTELVDSVQVRALVETRLHAFERSPDPGLKRLGESMKRALWHDPRRAASKLPRGPLSAVIAQIQMGHTPSKADKRRALEMIQSVLLARAYERAIDNGPDMPAQLQATAGALEAFDRLLEKLSTPDLALREQLNSLAISTMGTSLPSIVTITKGRHTKDLVLGTDASHDSGETDER